MPSTIRITAKLRQNVTALAIEPAVVLLDEPFASLDASLRASVRADVQEIFRRHGEPSFRDGERRVIARLLDGPVRVLATGGGAFMDARTRARIRERGISIWLRADLDLLHQRVSRRNNRPLLKQGNPREILALLIDQRYPVYALSDITVDTVDGPPEATMDRVMAALERHLSERAVTREPAP